MAGAVLIYGWKCMYIPNWNLRFFFCKIKGMSIEYKDYVAWFYIILVFLLILGNNVDC